MKPNSWCGTPGCPCGGKPKQEFIIQDWAGNTLFNGKTFKTFEEGWEYIYLKYEHLSEADAEDLFQDLYVKEVPNED